jgi:hypothetical protein
VSGVVTSPLPNVDVSGQLCGARKSMKDGLGISQSHLSMDGRLTITMPCTNFIFFHSFSDF